MSLCYETGMDTLLLILPTFLYTCNNEYDIWYTEMQTKIMFVILKLLICVILTFSVMIRTLLFSAPCIDKLILAGVDLAL